MKLRRTRDYYFFQRNQGLDYSLWWESGLWTLGVRGRVPHLDHTVGNYVVTLVEDKIVVLDDYWHPARLPHETANTEGKKLDNWAFQLLLEMLPKMYCIEEG